MSDKCCYFLGSSSLVVGKNGNACRHLSKSHKLFLERPSCAVVLKGQHQAKLSSPATLMMNGDELTRGPVFILFFSLQPLPN